MEGGFRYPTHQNEHTKHVKIFDETIQYDNLKLDLGLADKIYKG